MTNSFTLAQKVLCIVDFQVIVISDPWGIYTSWNATPVADR